MNCRLSRNNVSYVEPNPPGTELPQHERLCELFPRGEEEEEEEEVVEEEEETTSAVLRSLAEKARADVRAGTPGEKARA